ncbi:Bug family tripartite tricarboxylate transporter substrate binding protein [Peptoniphilus catoniae]|uniref:Bug family tripartite tricarboxylate transporter substrate binding protein n=1 Tax=Peptoniphilus catoniae TaxID=1660341 RepID=UPI0010FDB6ED|nr:tripartite tricarboxylate transporter substrate binding protein [Peptoniphilus catoniae]
MFKKNGIIVSILALILVMSVAACGKKENATNNSKEANTETTETTTNETTETTGTSSLRPEGLPEDYPNKDITYLYGFSAGSIQDAYIRILFDKIKEMEGWKHGMVVNYQEGASGRIEWNQLATAKPDGYTIGFTPSAIAIPSVSEKGKNSFDFDSFDYTFNMMSDPGAIGVAANSPYNSLKELVAAAKEKPGTISIGVTSAIGSEGLTVKQIQKLEGAKFNITAFDGGADVVANVIGGHIDAFCLNVGDTTSFLENGQIKVLATGASERSPYLPDVPTYQEEGYDVTQASMRTISFPKGVDPAIRKYIENCLMAAANDPEVKAKAEEMKIPVDSKGSEEITAEFTKQYEALLKLWESDPWQ